MKTHVQMATMAGKPATSVRNRATKTTLDMPSIERADAAHQTALPSSMRSVMDTWKTTAFSVLSVRSLTEPVPFTAGGDAVEDDVEEKFAGAGEKEELATAEAAKSPIVGLALEQTHARHRSNDAMLQITANRQAQSSWTS